MQVNLLKYKESYGKIIILIGLFSVNARYAGSTIRQIYTAIDTMPKAVVMNDIIPKHPVNHVRYTKPVKAASAMKFLPVEKQAKFLEAAKQHTLWHTYATHMIKREMRPKVLQKLPEHVRIQTAMDRYVHITEESMEEAVHQFEAAKIAAS